MCPSHLSIPRLLVSSPCHSTSPMLTPIPLAPPQVLVSPLPSLQPSPSTRVPIIPTPLSLIHPESVLSHTAHPHMLSRLLRRLECTFPAHPPLVSSPCPRTPLSPSIRPALRLVISTSLSLAPAFLLQAHPTHIHTIRRDPSLPFSLSLLKNPPKGARGERGGG